jgi:hypothetical protein
MGCGGSQPTLSAALAPSSLIAPDLGSTGCPRSTLPCVLTQEALDRLQPTVEDGQRVSALRFGDPRVMALFQALCVFSHLPRGFRNRDLRPRVEALAGRPYSTAQMTYDLRRLRLKGLIHRIPGTHRYTATTDGLRTAFFYSKLYLRILRPHWRLGQMPSRVPAPASSSSRVISTSRAMTAMWMARISKPDEWAGACGERS